MAFLSITLCAILLFLSIWFLCRAISLHDCAKKSVEVANTIIDSTPLYHKGIKQCYYLRTADSVAVVCEYETNTKGRNHSVVVKHFYYDVDDINDYDLAIMQAEELIEKLID